MSFKKIISVLCCVTLCAACAACSATVQAPGDQGRPGISDGDKKPGGQTPSDGEQGPGDIAGEIPDDNDVEVTEPDMTDHDFGLTSQSGGVLTFNCSDCGKQETVTITYVSGTKNAYSVSGNTITFGNIAEKSEYEIRGSLHGNIVIDVDEQKLELSMSGFSISSYTECPIAVLSGDKVTLSAKKDSENNIYDLRDGVDSSDEDAVSSSVYAKCDLAIQGKGSLSVKSVNNNGIHTTKDLNVKNLSLQVDCMDNALKGNDSVTVESGELVLIARRGDGIKTRDSDVSQKGNQRGDVTVTGGNLLIYAACDGIDAAHDVVIDESTADVVLQIFTDKYSKYSEEVTAVDSVYYVRYNSDSYKYSLKFYNDDSDFVWHNSSSYSKVGNYYYYSVTKPSGYSYVQLYVYNSSQQQGQDNSYVGCSDNMTINNNYDTIALQSRGNNLSFSWTNYTTSSQGGMSGPGNQGGMGGPGGMGNQGGMGGMDDGNTDKGDYSTKGIKADNQIVISAGTITISAYDDALHANNDVALENGQSPLGNVTVSGGTLTLRSNDDGIHADGKATICGGNVTVVGSYEGIEGKTVEISGGDVSITSSDDGINGTATSGTAITISGGKLYVYAGGDGVDSNSTTSYSGILFSGGKSVIISTGNSDSSIDTEQGYKYTGGYVVGIGKSGGMGSEATKCQNFSSVGKSATVSLQSGGYLVVSDFATVKMPTSISALVVILGSTGASISSAASTSYNLDNNGVYWN